MTSIHDSAIAVVRTAVPALVGTFFAWLLSRGISVPAEVQGSLTVFFVTLCITGYYSLVTLLERKVNPAFGWLLGVAKTPSYRKTEQ